jgi:hypothetical protein
MKDGSASQWANNVVLAMQTQDATRSYSTWETFQLAVIEAFKGGGQIEIAQAKMEKLHQGKSMAMEYFTVLDSLNKTAACDEVTLIRLLNCGINEKVIKVVWKTQVIKHNGLNRTFQVMGGSLRDGGNTVSAPKMHTLYSLSSYSNSRKNEWKNPANNPVTHFRNNPVSTATSTTTTTTAPVPMDIDCEFEKREVEYLGVIIRNGKIQMDPVKVASVGEWATPRNLKDVQSFLGFLKFYHRFIQGFGDHAKPLTQ